MWRPAASSGPSSGEPFSGFEQRRQGGGETGADPGKFLSDVKVGRNFSSSSATFATRSSSSSFSVTLPAGPFALGKVSDLMKFHSQRLVILRGRACSAESSALLVPCWVNITLTFSRFFEISEKSLPPRSVAQRRCWCFTKGLAGQRCQCVR